MLAITGLGEGNKTAIVLGKVGLAMMDFREPSDRSLELFLLGEQSVDKIARILVLTVRAGESRPTLQGGGQGRLEISDLRFEISSGNQCAQSLFDL